MRVTCIAVTVMLAALGLEAQEFVVPQPDLRVAVPLAPLRAAVNRFDAVAYEGEVQLEVGPARLNCDFHVQIQGPQFQGDAWNRYTDGAGGFRGGITTGVKAFTNNASCVRGSADVKVEAAACTDILDPVMSVRGSLSALGIAVPLSLPLPNPFIMPQRLAIHLEPIEPANGLDMKLEFGDFVDGKWVAAERPLDRSISVHGVLRGLGGTDAGASGICDGVRAGVTSVRRNVDYLAADLSFARAGTVGAPSLAAADQLLDSMGGAPNVVELSASPRLIGDGNDGVGLVGAILPLRLSGTYEYQAGKKLSFAIALVSGRAEFRDIDGRPSVLVGFRLTPLRVWISDTAGDTELSPNNLIATMVMDAPALRNDGSVALKVREFGVGFNTTIGSADVCVNAQELEKALNKDTIIIGVMPDIKIELQDCIDVGSDRVNASRPCADGQSRGRLANNHMDRNTTLRLDVRNPQTSIKNGRLSIAIPLR